MRIVIITATIFAMMMTLFFTQAQPTFAFKKNMSNENKGYTGESAKLRKVNIDDDFADDTIIVVLTRQETLRFRTYTTGSFPEIDLVSIENLTASSGEIVIADMSRRQLVKTNQARAIMPINTMQVRVDEFKTILRLVLKEPSKENVLSSIELLQSRKEILSAEPDYILQTATSAPNDTYYLSGGQWGLNGINGIRAPQAWTMATGANSVMVGVIDTGIQANHPDLQGRVNLDLSRDFSLTSPYIPTSVTDPDGHGTHVAGIIAASGNNGIGVTGVAQSIQLVSLRINATGPNWEEVSLAYGSQLVLAINHAATNNIPILNNSNRSFNATTDTIEAFETAINNYRGLFITAAGNESTDNDTNTTQFPSPQFRRNNMLAVGSLDSNGSRSSFSNWGVNTVDIWAPGGDILSTFPTASWGTTIPGYTQVAQGYARTSGTSMAAPMVAGVAGLMLSVDPTLTPEQLRNNIIDSATWVNITHPSGFWGSNTISVRRLNAETALMAVSKFTIRNLTDTNVEITGEVGNMTGNLVIPKYLNGRIVTQIGNSAFSGQNQLTQITIPSTVTHIGNDAFKNTNNVSIYLEGKSSVPSTFKVNWNASGNPVYLNGNLCTHPSTTLTKSNHTQHGHLCNDCKTFTSKSNHGYNHNHIPNGTAPSGIAIHLSICACGDSVTMPCASIFPHEPGDTVICWYCGQIFSNPILYTITLTNGEVFVSNVPFTYEMYKMLSIDLGIAYSYSTYLTESAQSQILNLETKNEILAIIVNNRKYIHEMKN